MKTWLCDSGQKVEIFIPFLGKCRPFSGRCCQICTPKSWEGFHYQHLSHLGFRDAVRVTEEDTRYRGWLVRRVCGFMAVWGWEVPADAPTELPARVCHSRRVRDAATGCSRGDDSESPQHWEEKVLEILAEIQAPLSLLTLRLCNWALLKLLSRLFLGVQVHRGQLEMVLRATRMPGVPLVFLSRHRSLLDGLLLSFLLCSQGLGVPRVTVGGLACSPCLRALLRRLGGIFLPSRLSDRDEELPRAILAAYTEEVLRSRQPLLIFLEEPPAPLRLSAPAHWWLTMVYRAVQDGAVPDVLLVPIGIAYDVAPGGWPQDEAPRGLGACLWAACGALRRSHGCARLDLAQPFSLQEFVAKNLIGRSSGGEMLEELLLPSVLGTCLPPLEDTAEVPIPGPSTAAGSEAAEQTLVTRLGLHALSDSVACSAVMAVGVTSALLLHKHREGVLLSRLMQDFSWLLEEILLRQHDLGFSGQLRALVQHSLVLLGPCLTCHHLAPPGDVLVVPKASAQARRELGHHSAALLPIFANEAVGACAIHALVMEMLPFLGAAAGPSDIVLSQDELHRKSLELLRLLPPNLLGLQPCQPLTCRSQDIVDKLLLCGLLQAEEPEGKRWVCDLALHPPCAGVHWPGGDITDSDSDDEGPKRCFKLSTPQGCPSLLLFLCRLLSPVLQSYAGAVAFLQQASWPQPEAACVEALQQLLAQEGWEPPDRSLALSSLQTFKEMGVLEEVQTPAGPLLQLSQLFRSGTNREKLGAFIQQFLWG